MHIFDGTILKNFRIKFINQNQKSVEQAIPPIYNLQRNQYENEACKVYIENGQIVKIELANGQEPPRRQVQSPVTTPTIGGRSSGAPASTTPHRAANENKFTNYLPEDTKKLIKQEHVENYLLKLQKYASAENPETPKEKFIFYKTERGEEKFKVIPNYTEAIFKSITTRHYSNAKSLLGEANIKDMNLKTDWRMALGLGNESVYETSITLHHIYGIPYIPASAIKGVVRSWIITNCFADENNQDNPLKDGEKRALQNKLFCDIFGSPAESARKEHQGKIIFFDAFPTDLKNESIKVDIMNPHYGPYYSDSTGATPPADYHNPVPIPFLTVENTSFQLIVGTKNQFSIKELNEDRFQQDSQVLIEKVNELIKVEKELNTPMFQSIEQFNSEFKIENSKSLLELTSLWLKLALTEHGIGAKTAVGYGYMK